MSGAATRAEREPRSGERLKPTLPRASVSQLTMPVAIACVMLIGLIGAGYYVSVRTRPASPRGSPLAITSIAVLPFRPLIVEGRDASLELGMADSLIMKLGSLGQITVRPLSAVRRYTDVEQDAVKAGREFRVDAGTGRAHPKAAGSDQGERKSASCPRWTAAMGRSVR